MFSAPASPHAPPIAAFCQILLSEKYISLETAQKITEEAVTENIPILKYLIDRQIFSSTFLANVIAKNFGLPLLDLKRFKLDEALFKSIKESLIEKHRVLPLLQRNERLWLAIGDPCQQNALNEIKFQTGLNAFPVIVDAVLLEKQIHTLLSQKQNAELDSILSDNQLDQLQIGSAEESLDDNQIGSDDAPVVRYINKVLIDAIQEGASDIHFEPYEKTYRIRFRVDGLLREIKTPPASLSTRFAARLKILSQLDISERRIPQDGRFKIKISQKQVIDFRVNTCPTVDGEKIVMRILDPSIAAVGIEKLGFNEQQRTLFLNALAQPHGLILVTGPTGSGKTVTLYTGLQKLNTSDKNICTVEDPIEIKLYGVNQVNVNIKTGFTFATALRAFLRQDPDIIMVGEMRDLETASIGIKAAQTGHLVLSTLHTNSAVESLARLLNMGVEAFNVTSAVTLIIAQRLARKLCEHCKAPAKLPLNWLKKQPYFSEHTEKDCAIFKPIGCERCIHGYKGRIGIFEILPMSEEIAALLLAGESAQTIAAAAYKAGLQDLHHSGLEKVLAGITSLEEINRITKSNTAADIL